MAELLAEAESGDAEAQNDLGGRLMETDAQAVNDKHAATLLERWQERITPEVDREAWAIADRWMAEHMSQSAHR